jgi:hypothetical protein
LDIAHRLGKKILVIDSEAGSASLYADTYAFDTESDFPDHHPHRYLKTLEEAKEQGYDVVIIDSITHSYSGVRGILELVGEVKNKSGQPDSMRGWNQYGPLHARMIQAIAQAPFHTIATCRAKEDAIVYDNSGDRKEATRVEYKLQQRDGVEYEFDLVLRVLMDHSTIVTKTRYPSEVSIGHTYGRDEIPKLSADILKAVSAGAEIGEWDEAPLARYVNALAKGGQHDLIRHAVVVGELNGKKIPTVIESEKLSAFLAEYQSVHGDVDPEPQS